LEGLAGDEVGREMVIEVGGEHWGAGTMGRWKMEEWDRLAEGRMWERVRWRGDLWRGAGDL
jgi:hypothetical protein